MKIFNFLRKNLISFLVVVLSVVMFFSVAAFCWFAQSDGFSTNFKSSTATAYFAGGDGSCKEPYQIKDPVHLYNLAWLQYLGYFNLRSGFNNGRAQSYFTLTADIDMSGYTLPPIGTEKYPFIGNFNGNGFAVTNLTVSNGFNDFNGKIYPVNAVFDKKENNGILYYFSADTTTTSAASFLGMFGVTGNYNNTVTNSYTTTVHPVTDKLDKGIVPEKNEFYMSEMSVEGFYLDYVKVKSYANTALVGFIAGYVAGDVKNAGVYQSRIEFENAATAAPMGDVTDNAVSKYGLVGDYDSSTVAWRNDTVPGDDGSWGGSIDMKMINRRLNYMFTEGEISDTVSKSDTYHTNIKINNFEYYWRRIRFSSNVATLYEGTVIPLNVDESAMYLDEETENSDYDKTTTKGTRTLHTNAFYETKQAEIVDKQRNAGYIVGGGTVSPRSRIQSLSGISKSLGDDTSSFNGDNLTLLTTDAFGNVTYKIDSGATVVNSAINRLGSKQPSDFSYYNSVRKNFIKTMTGENYVHGFHFMNTIDESNWSSSIYPGTDVWIENEHYDNYQFIKGGLNFSVKEDNSLRVIAGTYYASKSGNSEPSHALFDLYYLKRTKGVIDSLTKINRIYEQNGKIYYNTKPSGSGVKTVIDFSSLNSNSGALKYYNAAYYYEIPIVKDYDYVIGAAKSGTSSNTAYLMYLDIGADGSSGTTDTKYSVSMVDFVNYCNTKKLQTYIDTNNQYPQFDDIYAKISEANAGSYVYFRRQSDGNSSTFPQSKSILGYVSNGLTIGFTPTGGGKVDQEAENVWQNSE